MYGKCYLIVSDLHGSESGIELVKSAVKRYKPIEIISAGDQCPDPFEPLYSSLIAVRGNCDRFYEYGSIPFPPLFRKMRIFGHRTVITHGDRLTTDDFDLKKGSVFISGHTHIPELEEQEGIYLLNPGSPSRPRSSSGPTAGLFLEDRLEIVSLLDFKLLSALAFSKEKSS